MDGAEKLLNEGDKRAELTAVVKLQPRQGKLTGVANDGTQRDRIGDQIVASGAEADVIPFPLLLDHLATCPVGVVTRLWASGGKLRFEAQLAKPEPGTPMADRVAEAVARLDAGVTSVSIGFRGLEQKPLPDGGILYTRVSVHEISLVSVPCSPGSYVESHKAIPSPVKAPENASPSLWKRIADIGLAEMKGSEDGLCKDLGPVFGTQAAIARSNQEMMKALCAHIEILEQRLDEPSLAYAGVHQRALAYRRGQAVTYKGSLYIALKSTEPGEMPGESSSWQLAVKAGRDGKDAH